MTFNPSNLILRELEPAVVLRSSSLEQVQLKRGTVLQEAGASVSWVWFPDTALLSTSSEGSDGESVSGGLIGRDGVYGAFEACGSRISFSDVVVQIGGDAWRCRAEHYRELFDQSANLRAAVHKHMEAMLMEARQSVACTALHPLHSRLCRLLLEASERSHQGPRITLTQESLAGLLGVQRSTIAAACSNLQKAGQIRTGRGSIEILDFAGVEADACSCRKSIAEAHQRIFASTAQVCGAESV